LNYENESSFDIRKKRLANKAELDRDPNAVKKPRYPSCSKRSTKYYNNDKENKPTTS
ncbi:1863_t:CDS:1, partial [Dentiscutata heterogama]